MNWRLAFVVGGIVFCTLAAAAVTVFGLAAYQEAGIGGAAIGAGVLL